MGVVPWGFYKMNDICSCGLWVRLFGALGCLSGLVW